MLTEYIRKLLEVHNRIIVPDLGAFMIKIDESQTIYFNEFLRFNDGLLVDYIAQKENIVPLDAAKITKTFVENIKKKLQTEKKYKFEGIGILKFDEHNKKILIPIREGIIHEDRIQQIINDPPVEEKKTTDPEESGSLIQVAKQVNIIEKKTVAITAKKDPIENTSLKEPLRTEKVITPVKNPEFSEKHRGSSKFDYFASNAIWIIPVILVILMATDYLIFFRTPSTKTFPITIVPDSTKTIKASAIIPKKNTPAMDTTSETIVPENKISDDIPLPIATTTKLYYLVAGCFKIEYNADNFVVKLREEGFDSKKFGTLGSLFCVSFSSYDNKSLALTEMKKIKSGGKYETWLIYY